MRLLRLALEEAGIIPTSEEPTLVMKGPLAEIYSQALNVAYAKPDPVTGETEHGTLAQETQANDALTAQAMAAQNADAEQAAPATVTIFGVAQSEITPQTVVDLTQAIAERPAETGVADFYLILDATRPGPNSEGAGAPEERMVQIATESEEAAAPPAADAAEITPKTDDGVNKTVPVEGEVVEQAPQGETPVEEVAVVLDVANPEAATAAPATPTDAEAPVDKPATAAEQVNSEVQTLAAAMECLVECHGGKVFRSLAEYQAHVAKK